MKYIKYYELENEYHIEKDTHDYPSVSYTKDTDKVWYMKNNQIKMIFSITEDDVNNYGGSDLIVWENSVLFDSVKVGGVEQKMPIQEKNVIITGESTEAVVLDITLENSVTQGEVVVPQPMSMTIEEDGNSSSELAYIINMTDENKLPFSSGKITVKLTNRTLNTLSYRPSFYVRYKSMIEEESMTERTEYALLDWYTAQDSFGMVVSDDGTEMTLTLPSEVNITHLFIVPMDSAMDSDMSLEPEVEGIYLDENYLLYSYETNNIILPCQLICGGEFMFDESCYINDKCINKCDLIFNEPISEEKLISDADKYYITTSFQVYQDGAWYNPFNFTQPLSVLIENGATDCFIINEKSELVGLDLYYNSEGLVGYLGPTARMLAHVVYDENAVQNVETGNFIVNVNEDTLVGSYINMIIGGMPKLSLPTTEARDYEVVATIYNDVTDMSLMFNYCDNLTSLDLSNFNTSNVTNMQNMFSSCSGLTSLDLSSLDTSNVTDMFGMFYNCGSLTSITFGGGFNTSNVTDMHYMFKGCSGLTSITFGNNFNTSNVIDMHYMFSGCTSLTSLDLSSFDTSNVTSIDQMFMDCSGLTSLDLSNFDASNVSSTTFMFHNCTSLTSLKYFKKTPSTAIQVPYAVMSVDFSAWDMSNVTSMENMFNSCSGLTSLDLSSLDTSNVTDMFGMFYNCGSLTSITFGGGFNTSNVTTMHSMFTSCSGLTSLDLSSFDTSNVTDMDGMFNCCYGLTSLDLSNFDTSNVTDMGYMFRRCSGLTSLDLSNFDTSNVTNMSNMFNSCSGLTSITFGLLGDVSKVTSYTGCTDMFTNITTTGTLYYPSAYESAWNNILVTKQFTIKFPSTWTATAVDYENE